MQMFIDQYVKHFLVIMPVIESTRARDICICIYFRSIEIEQEQAEQYKT